MYLSTVTDPARCTCWSLQRLWFDSKTRRSHSCLCRQLVNLQVHDRSEAYTFGDKGTIRKSGCDTDTVPSHRLHALMSGKTFQAHNISTEICHERCRLTNLLCADISTARLSPKCPVLVTFKARLVSSEMQLHL